MTNKHNLNKMEMTIEEKDELIKELYEEIEGYKLHATKTLRRLQLIQKRSLILWKYLDKYNPFRYSDSIDYIIDSISIHPLRLKVKGWVISKKTKNEVDIKIRGTVKLNHYAREDVNKLKGFPKEYKSGFETISCPVLPLSIKFYDGKEMNEFRINGLYLFIKAIFKLIKLFIRTYKKEGLKRTLKKCIAKIKGENIDFIQDYNEWFMLHRASKDDLTKQRNMKFNYSPLISIVIPTYNTPIKLLKELIESIKNQTYTNWELCIADGHSTNQKTIEYLKEINDGNKIKVNFLEENYMISGNTNEAIKIASGEFVALMDHDDLIEPDALFEFVKLLNEDEDLDFIYTDEDKISEDSKTYSAPHFKPDFSIDNLRCYNYITHFSLIRRSLFDEIGLFDSKCDGAQDYDMFLRIVDHTQKIGHIAKPLYHWRIIESSTASSAGAKPYVIEAGKQSLRNHLERNNIKGTVKEGLAPTIYKVDYEIIDNPKISIVICTKDHIDDLNQCIQSILTKTTYKNYEIIVVENNSTEKETFEYYKTLEKYENIKVVYWEDEFNYSAINNFGVKYATGEYILLLNNDIEVISENWLTEMLMQAQRKEVGCVGAKLLYPDNTIQHAGVIIGIGGVAGHSHKYFDSKNPGYVGRLLIVQMYPL